MSLSTTREKEEPGGLKLTGFLVGCWITHGDTSMQDVAISIGELRQYLGHCCELTGTATAAAWVQRGKGAPNGFHIAPYQTGHQCLSLSTKNKIILKSLHK